MNRAKKIAWSVVVIMGLLFAGYTVASAAGCTPFFVATGGTGNCSFSSGGYLYGNGTSAIGATSSPTVGWITGTSTATSSFKGGVRADILNTSSTTASSTFANGLNLSTGCISYNGTCITQNAGTVTSVAATVPSVLSIAGSPITGSGTLAFTYSGTALPIANGGTAATSFTTTNNAVYYTGSVLATAPLTSAIIVPYATTTSISSTGGGYFSTTGGNTSVGSSTPWAFFSVNANAIGTAPQFAVGSSTGTNLIVTSGGLFGIASSTPNFSFSLNNAGSDFYITSAGKIVGVDTTNAWSGRISPTHSFVLTTGTTTTWTATTSGAYVPFITVPFAGTLRQARCLASTTASFLGVAPRINGVLTTPSYFVASTTVGTIKFTANNTFTAGQRIDIYVGTTTSDANALTIGCTFDTTET